MGGGGGVRGVFNDDSVMCGHCQRMSTVCHDESVMCHGLCQQGGDAG